MPKSKPFESAEFYDTQTGREQLQDDCAEDAIERHFDELFMAPGDTLAGRIEEECPLTVYGFTRVDVDLTVWADGLADTLEEFVREDEEIAGEDEDSVEIEWDRAELVKAIEDAIRPFGSKVTPWVCEQTSKREYSEEEVTAILRARCPSWFAEAADVTP